MDRKEISCRGLPHSYRSSGLWARSLVPGPDRVRVPFFHTARHDTPPTIVLAFMDVSAKSGENPQEKNDGSKEEGGPGPENGLAENQKWSLSEERSLSEKFCRRTGCEWPQPASSSRPGLARQLSHEAHTDGDTAPGCRVVRLERRPEAGCKAHGDGGADHGGDHQEESDLVDCSGGHGLPLIFSRFSRSPDNQCPADSVALL